MIIAASQTQQTGPINLTNMTSRYSMSREQCGHCVQLLWSLREINFDKNVIFMGKKIIKKRELQEKNPTSLNKQKERSRVGHLTTIPAYPNPDIPQSLVELTHLNQYHFHHLYSLSLELLLPALFPSVAVFSIVSGVYVVHL